jgi:hypothetical protein
MNASELSLVPLKQASLCLDCDMISSGHTYCFACGSTALLNLARTLNGREHSGSGSRVLADVTGISPRRNSDAHTGSNQLRQPRWFSDDSGSLAPAFSEASSEEDDERWWYSIRHVAAVVHRVVTPIILILVLGAAARLYALDSSRSANIGTHDLARVSRTIPVHAKHN